MSFERQKLGQSADERLAQLLSEQPIRMSAIDVQIRRPYDFCRVLVITLLLSSVAGAWALAYFL